MKHCILITAYTQLSHLLDQLDIYDADADFSIYVHWDKKFASAEVLEKIAAHPSAKRVCHNYCVNWGGRNLLAAMQTLCRMALDDLEANGNPDCFIHNISGTDILLRSLAEVKDFFNRHRNEGFMTHFKLPYTHWTEGGLNRLTWRHPLDRLNIHDIKQCKIYHRYLSLQQSSGKRRPLPVIQLYGGDCWWSLPREMADYWLQHSNDGGLFDRMADVYCPEEIQPQTVLLNSLYAKRLCNDSLHYICWDYGTRGTPALLENHDLPYMQQSENIWARKVASGSDDGVKRYFQWFRELPFLPTQPASPADLLPTLADHVGLHAPQCPLYGLMSGRMGAAVFLLCYGKLYAAPRYVDTGIKILDSVISRRKALTTSDFNNGSLGIAYALAWLCKHGFADRKTYEYILEDFDKKVRAVLVSSEATAYLHTPFWQSYFQYGLYSQLRDLPQADSCAAYPEHIISLLGKAGTFRDRSSIGLAGLSGLGLNSLRLVKPDLMPNFVSYTS